MSKETSIPHPTLQTKGLKLRMVTRLSNTLCKQATPAPDSDASTVTRLMKVVWLSMPLGTPPGGEQSCLLGQPCTLPTPAFLIQPGQALTAIL